jgi:hypothetical protein
MKEPIQDHNLPNPEEYTDCMIAFIDILGFDSKVRNMKSREDFSKVGKILFSLKETEKRINTNRDLFKNLTITAVSDSIIITMPYQDPICATAIISMAHMLQYDSIATSFETLLRGYLTRGYVYHKDNIIFGEGYSKAYQKEKEIGHAPRIVIDPKIIEDGKKKSFNYKGKEKMAYIFDLVTKDTSDGCHFIDYLKPLRLEIGESRKNLIAERSKIKVFIENSLKLYKDDERIRPKYEWLKNYFLSTEHYLKETNNSQDKS